MQINKKRSYKELDVKDQQTEGIKKRKLNEEETKTKSEKKESQTIDLFTEEQIELIQEQKQAETHIKVQQGSSRLKHISQDMLKNYNDGKRIFINRLEFYPDDAIQEYMISYWQLMYKDLGFKNHMKGKVDVKVAILGTMGLDEELIRPLIEAKVPITLFGEMGEKKAELVNKDKQNMNEIYQEKWGYLNYGTYHSKQILYEFDDRLRVIIPSGNTYPYDWEQLSQVIWFQDFYPLQKNITQSQTDNDFKEILMKYIDRSIPYKLKNKEVFRKKIDLNKYDFSTAQAYLVASVNGRFGDPFHMTYGQNRLGALVPESSKSDKTITYVSSSIGKVLPKFLLSFYHQFGSKKPTSSNIHSYYKIVYPTDKFVENSHLGVAGASSQLLKDSNWTKAANFPKQSFCKVQGITQDLDGNLFHAKIIIVTEKDKESDINDNTILYFGSHNLSTAAWGNIEKDGSFISIANWELGVMFPPKEGSKQMKQNIMKSMVFKYPAEQYKKSEIPKLNEVEMDFLTVASPKKKKRKVDLDESCNSSQITINELFKNIKFEEEVSKLTKDDQIKKIKEEEKEQLNDGKRIFINKLKYYPQEVHQDSMITFNQLLNKDLSISSDLNNPIVEVKCAIFTTYSFRQQILSSLFKNKVPLTIFVDRAWKGPLWEKSDNFNMHKIHIERTGIGKVMGRFHSKLILYEFDDRLRIIISSANLTLGDWETYGQVIWFQDFFPVQAQQENKLSKNDFKEYLTMYLAKLIPLRLRKKEIYRQKIDLDKYNFKTASIHLVASINGKFTDNQDQMFGMKRIKTLLQRRRKIEKSRIWYQTSSIGKLSNKFFMQFYYQVTGHAIKQEQVGKRIRVIYPTLDFARQSHVGKNDISNVRCLMLQSHVWNNEKFPKESFYKLEGKSEKLNGIICHTKLIIVTDADNEINDQTFLYFGSHNFSPSAWGKIQNQSLQMIIANWELGVVFLPKKGSQLMKQKMIESLNIKFPCDKYQANDQPYLADVDYQQ